MIRFGPELRQAVCAPRPAPMAIRPWTAQASNLKCLHRRLLERLSHPFPSVTPPCGLICCLLVPLFRWLRPRFQRHYLQRTHCCHLRNHRLG